MTIWTVPAVVNRVVDGDTVNLTLDLGWHITLVSNVRLTHINSPELGEPGGAEAKAFLRDMLLPGSGVMFQSHSLDKYGRPLGAITFKEQDVATLMVTAGHARWVM